MIKELLKSRILIVDDEPDNIFMLEEILKGDGFSSIQSVTDPREVCGIYKQFQPDLVLLDINMPYLDGFQVMEQLKEIEKHSYIPVIILTSESDEQTLLRALNAGAKDFLVKPLNFPEVLCRIKNMLEVRLLHNQVKDQNKNLENVINNLTKTGTAISSESNVDALLEKIISYARKLTGADAGTLYILENNLLHFKIVQNDTLGGNMGGPAGKPASFPPVKLVKSNVSAYAALEGTVVNIPDVYDSDLFDFTGPKKFDAATGYRSRSMLVVPMKNHENVVLGVFQLLNCKDQKTGNVIPFSKEAENYAVAVASQAAMALNNAFLIRDLKATFESFVEVMATAIDEKSPVTGNHIRKVSDLSLEMARTINETDEGKFKDISFDEEKMHELRLACLMHDIGKVTTPVEIVEKGKKLETIFNRMNYVDLRFRYLIQKVLVEELQTKLNLIQNKSDKKELLEEDENTRGKIKELDDIRLFLKNCNEPGEFLDDDKIERLKTISKMTFKDNDGNEQPYLTGNELLNLSIRKGSITEAERKVMQNHAAVTLKMLKKIPFSKKLEKIPQFAGAHHEFINGKGYPLGLKGDEIPFEGKLMAVADIAEALTATDRPYKKAMPMNVVNKILRSMAKDGELDTDLVELFINKNIYEQYQEKFEKKTAP